MGIISRDLRFIIHFAPELGLKARSFSLCRFNNKSYPSSGVPNGKKGKVMEEWTNGIMEEGKTSNRREGGKKRTRIGK
jgi:hypothetical protein